MTTVAALIRDGVVHMAADSQTNIYDRPVYTARKIIRRSVGSSDLLLGVAGDGAMAALLRYDWEMPLRGDYAELRWLNLVMSSITDLALERNIGLEDGRLTTSILIGHRGALYHGTHHQLVSPGMSCAAIGRGEEPAMATMLALQDHTTLGPEFILEHAIAYAGRLTNGTGGPIRYERA